ncbi:MAG: DUF3237 domain-containing protein [Lachnospiraceae bacterium]|nr:DUF3237 domain-containing protein [Lachnospiraceae bacterium]
MNKKTEVLTILVRIIGCHEVKGNGKTARMIIFDGDCDCENFKGHILQGGVDSQKDFEGEPFSLSARYVLEGTDKENNPCRMFIENNGGIENGIMKTTPMIVTDSPCLSYLQNEKLEGSIEGWEKGVIIHIFTLE